MTDSTIEGADLKMSSGEAKSEIDVDKTIGKTEISAGKVDLT
jgi:hypothetical protein